MYNPYQQIYNPYNIQQPQIQPSAILPQQQITQVSGKASVDTIQMAPNSSLLAMDTTAPIVWMCVSDGVGKVTSTPYDITVHQEKPSIDMTNVEQRLTNIENTITEMEGKLNGKSNATRSKSKSSLADDTED